MQQKLREDAHPKALSPAGSLSLPQTVVLPPPPCCCRTVSALLLLLLPPQFMGFQAQAGPASLNIATLAGRSNLLLQATLYAPSGSIVWSASGPGAQMTTRNLPATGTYYLRIASAGSGAFATNGFSNYGSRGQWEANATFVPCAVNCGTPLPPMLEVPPSTAPNQNPGNAPVAKVTSIGLTRVKTSDPAISQCSGEHSPLKAMMLFQARSQQIRAEAVAKSTLDRDPLLVLTQCACVWVLPNPKCV